MDTKVLFIKEVVGLQIISKILLNQKSSIPTKLIQIKVIIDDENVILTGTKNSLLNLSNHIRRHFENEKL